MTPIPEDWDIHMHSCKKLKRRKIMKCQVPKKVRVFLKKLNGLPVSQGQIYVTTKNTLFRVILKDGING